MINTIIFDLGNVLLSWKPAEYLNDNGFTEPDKITILRDVFNSREWLLLDNGDITIEEAVKSILGKSTLSESQIRAVFDLRLKILYPLRPNTDLLPELKKNGFRLYFLSNFPDDIFDEVRNKNEFFRYFDGGEISARLNVSKPDEKIFRLFLSKYSLPPSDCVFIDDSQLNVDSAARLGIKAIHLSSPELLKEKINETVGKIQTAC